MTMDRTLYIEKFGDPSNRSWKLKHSTDCHVLTAPNGGEFSIISGQVDFLQNFPVQPESSRMWLISLGFTSIIDEPEIIINILSAFLKNLDNPEFRNLVENGMSMDHSAAVRIRTMCFLHAKFDSQPVRLLARTIAERTAEWATAGTFAHNNHGMMLAISLLHARAIIFDQSKDHLLSTATIFLRNLFVGVFADDGYANENTIGYHEFYVKSLSSLDDFISAAGWHSTMPWLENTLSNAVRALHRVVRPNGSIPPIGESGEYFTKYPSINGIHVFEKCGFAVLKNEDFYLSIICGCASETHKQMDDTSITLQLKGIDFFIDGGLFNYDIKGPFRRLLQSQQSHSGIFVTEHDHLMRREFIIRNPDFSASLSHRNNSIVAEKKLGATTVRRKLLSPSEAGFELVDTIHTDLAFPVVQRFLIPHSATVVIHPTHVSIGNGGLQIDIVPNYEFNSALTRRNSVPTPKGWRSIKFNELIPAQCLEIFPERTDMELKIRINADLSKSDLRSLKL